ncbi:CBN-COL-68 protein, partial [Aphelenchoides avenae]
MADKRKLVEDEQLLREAESFRRLAFAAVTISTVATLVAIIAVPMLYNYATYVQSSLEVELDFCHHRSAGLWNEYSSMTGLRGKRAAMQRSAGWSGRNMAPRASARGAASYSADGGAGGYGGGSAPVSGGGGAAGGYGGGEAPVSGGQQSSGGGGGGGCCSCG